MVFHQRQSMLHGAWVGSFSGVLAGRACLVVSIKWQRYCAEILCGGEGHIRAKSEPGWEWLCKVLRMGWEWLRRLRRHQR